MFIRPIGVLRLKRDIVYSHSFFIRLQCDFMYHDPEKKCCHAWIQKANVAECDLKMRRSASVGVVPLSAASCAPRFTRVLKQVDGIAPNVLNFKSQSSVLYRCDLDMVFWTFHLNLQSFHVKLHSQSRSRFCCCFDRHWHFDAEIPRDKVSLAKVKQFIGEINGMLVLRYILLCETGVNSCYFWSLKRDLLYYIYLSRLSELHHLNLPWYSDYAPRIAMATAQYKGDTKTLLIYLI